MKSKMIVVVVAVALLGLLGIGAQAADQKEPIKIGAFFALSGPAANIGTPTKLVAQMVVDKINKEGGINGRPIELIMGDTESDPAKAAIIAKKFIFKDKVAAIIGPTSTGRGDERQEDRRGGRGAHLHDRRGRPGDHGRQLRRLTTTSSSRPSGRPPRCKKLYGYLKAKS